MRLNQRLTVLVSGQTIHAVNQKGEWGQIIFADGSVMTLDLPSPLSFKVSRTAKIKVVRQNGRLMTFDFTDGTLVEISLSEETSCVLLRDAEGQLVYAD